MRRLSHASERVSGRRYERRHKSLCVIRFVFLRVVFSSIIISTNGGFLRTALLNSSVDFGTRFGFSLFPFSKSWVYFGGLSLLTLRLPAQPVSVHPLFGRGLEASCSPAAPGWPTGLWPSCWFPHVLHSSVKFWQLHNKSFSLSLSLSPPSVLLQNRPRAIGNRRVPIGGLKRAARVDKVHTSRYSCIVCTF